MAKIRQNLQCQRGIGLKKAVTGICVTEADKTRPKDFEIFQFYAWVLVTFPLISESERGSPLVIRSSLLWSLGRHYSLAPLSLTGTAV